MTRVSENSNAASLQYAVNKAKQRMEDLQIKGTTLKRISKPSDDPMSNFQGIQLRTTNLDNKQYLRNISYALNQLNTTEKTLEQLTEIMSKAKEIAIQQASDFYGGQIRENVSHEIIQLRNQALALANKRIGNRHIFAGYNSLKTPFDKNGEYHGDTEHIQLEIAKDFFVPINMHGEEVFFTNDQVRFPNNPIKDFDELPRNKENIERTFGRYNFWAFPPGI
jgi:flagellar hook-associated protein 3 FlgL